MSTAFNSLLHWFNKHPQLTGKLGEVTPIIFLSNKGQSVATLAYSPDDAKRLINFWLRNNYNPLGKDIPVEQFLMALTPVKALAS